MKNFILVIVGLSGLGLISSTIVKSTKLNIDTNLSSVTWIGKKVTGQHQGTVKIKSGSLTFENNKPVSGSFVMDMNTITCTDLSGESAGKMVGHLKSDDFFGVSAYPSASFDIKNVASTIDPKRFVITGDLTIKGITQSINFDAEVDMKNAKAKL